MTQLYLTDIRINMSAYEYKTDRQQEKLMEEKFVNAE